MQKKLFIRRGAVVVSFTCALLAGSAFAQGTAPPPAQALPNCAPTCRAGPIISVSDRRDQREDVRHVLAGLKSKDSEEWAAAWAAMGQHHATAARVASDAAEKSEHWHQAWLDFHFGAWPAQNTPGKRADYKKAIEVFREYAKLLDPPAETVPIPFEGKEIVEYLRLPPGDTSAGGDHHRGPRRIQGVWRRTWQRCREGRGTRLLWLDMPGTGEGRCRWRLAASA